MSQPVPLWLDVDTGHDDAYALLLAALHDKANLIGVSTTYGNAPVERTTNNTKAFLKAINQSHLEVFQGESSPLERPPIYATHFHGESGLDGVTVLPNTPITEAKESSLDTDAVARILLQQAPGSVWLVPTGPLTNVAKLLRDHPDLVSHIAGLSIMGGAVGGGYTDAPLGQKDGESERFGNWSPYAEFNILCDPEAARYIFNNSELAAKTSLITLDLTHQCRADEKIQKMLFSEDPASPLSRTRQLLKEILLYFAEAYHKQFSISDGPPLHDAVAVYAALRPDLFDDKGGERWEVEVVTRGERDGQTILRASDRGIRVPRGVNLPEFWASIASATDKAESLAESSTTSSSLKR